MSIDSKGYGGTVNYVDWAILVSRLGAQYSVFGPDAFKASVGVGDRAVAVLGGMASGQGIYDDSDSTVTLTGAPVASGNRWDMVALRRDWGAEESTLVLVQGTSAKAIPAERLTDIGDVDDQPLWLVRFTAGQTAAQEFVDLRAWHGDGGVVIADLMARNYLTRLGTRLWFGGVAWVRGLSGTGVATWMEDTGSWGALTGKPATYPPTSHIHDIADVWQDGHPIFDNYLPNTFRQKKATIVSARKGGVQGIPASVMSNVLSVSLGDAAPGGIYQIIATCATYCVNPAQHYKQVRVGGSASPSSGSILDGTSDAVTMPIGGVDVERTSTYQFTHGGGAVTVWLDAQVNANGASAGVACRLQVAYQGSA